MNKNQLNISIPLFKLGILLVILCPITIWSQGNNMPPPAAPQSVEEVVEEADDDEYYEDDYYYDDEYYEEEEYVDPIEYPKENRKFGNDLSDKYSGK